MEVMKRKKKGQHKHYNAMHEPHSLDESIHEPGPKTRPGITNTSFSHRQDPVQAGSGGENYV
jgi:hypothetical protein